MLRDNLVRLIEPMLVSAGANPLALCTARKKPSDDRPPCLENPRPEGAESTLTENAPSPFHAEPRHDWSGWMSGRTLIRWFQLRLHHLKEKNWHQGGRAENAGSDEISDGFGHDAY